MIGPMSPLGHIGHKVSALLDGQLSPSESERAWAHVHLCPPCRDLVEREGRLKQTLAQLGHPDRGTAPDRLKGALVSGIATLDPDGSWPMPKEPLERPRVTPAQVTGMSIIGLGTAAVALVGVAGIGSPLAWMGQERPPVTSIAPSTGPAPADSPATTPGVSEATTGSGSATHATRNALAPAQPVRPGHHFSRAIR